MTIRSKRVGSAEGAERPAALPNTFPHGSKASLNAGGDTPPATLDGLPAWVTKGAVFVADGCTSKIIRITHREVEVVNYDAFGSWPIRAFLVAEASGRIAKLPAGSGRAKAPSPSSSSRRGKLPQVAVHLNSLPISPGTPTSAVTLSAIRAFQAFRSGASVRPPDIILVEHLAFAGAYAEGLGPGVACRNGRRGRKPVRQLEACATQKLLGKFSQFVCGNDIDFSHSELGAVERLVRRGLEAFGLTSSALDRVPRRGRPRSRQHEEAVRQKLSHHWRDHRRGAYSAQRAIREVAKEIVLQKKQVIAAWNDEDFNALVLGREDEDAIATAAARISRTYFRRPKLTDAEVTTRRAQIAATLKFVRSIRIKRNSVTLPA